MYVRHQGDISSGAHTISTSTFDSGTQGWAMNVWASGPYSPGTMVWTGGIMRCIGIGQSDNDDECTHEGGEITKTIFTAGCWNIKVSYDLRVNNLAVI